MGAPRGAAKPASELARNGDLVRVSPHLPQDQIDVLKAHPTVDVGGVRVRVSISQHIAAACERLLKGTPAHLGDEPSGPIRQWWLPLDLVGRLDAVYEPAGRERAIALALERYVGALRKR